MVKQDGSNKAGQARGDLKKAVCVSIRKLEVAEIGRVRGIFNRGVSIRKPMTSGEWLVVSGSWQKGSEIAKNLRLGSGPIVCFLRLTGNSNRGFAIRNAPGVALRSPPDTDQRKQGGEVRSERVERRCGAKAGPLLA
jgi:hypothetical protein